jgi:hypothetical protein
VLENRIEANPARVELGAQGNGICFASLNLHLAVKSETNLKLGTVSAS